MVNAISLEHVVPHSRLPLLITPRQSAMSLLELARPGVLAVDALLLEHGALSTVLSSSLHS
jgi:hypothetical protein